MKKIETTIQPFKVNDVKSALIEIGITGMKIGEVHGYGRQKDHTEVYHGREYTVDLLSKIKVEIALPDQIANDALDTLIKVAQTGKIGARKVFVSSIDEVFRIRSSEKSGQSL